MIFLITGGSGFAAQCIAEEASARGHAVRLMSRAAAGKPDMLPWTSDPAALAETLVSLRPDVIFHGAGSASVADSLRDPAGDRMASVGTWGTLLEAVRLAALRPALLFPSSAAVYGNPASLPVGEDAPRHPISPYGRHKMECEILAERARVEAGLPVFVFRLFSLFGPAQKRLLVRELYERVLAPGGEVVLEGTGQESRDYLSAWDMRHAVLDFVEHWKAEPPQGWIYNLASGTETGVKGLTAMIIEIMNSHKTIRCRNASRPGDPQRWVAGISAFKSACPSWAPAPLRDSLVKTIAAWRKEDATA
ncbi:MAG: UDP-glucose 4-epimerase [Verrucomicrobiales bacterium]|nr:UDP-glucose 4-epimerase [Verrucomicrobiales bacterium]